MYRVKIEVKDRQGRLLVSEEREVKDKIPQAYVDAVIEQIVQSTEAHRISISQQKVKEKADARNINNPSV